MLTLKELRVLRDACLRFADDWLGRSGDHEIAQDLAERFQDLIDDRKENRIEKTD